MKTKNDPRHLKRIKVIQGLYSQKFGSTKLPELSEGEKDILIKINSNEQSINMIIDQYSTKFPTTKMSKLDLCILQLGVYELKFEQQVPYRVIIDECIEIAKEYGSMKSPNFVNGVLGKLIEETSHE